jgi:hypothetical protein
MARHTAQAIHFPLLTAHCSLPAATYHFSLFTPLAAFTRPMNSAR